jgi:hypothetical protein
MTQLRTLAAVLVLAASPALAAAPARPAVVVDGKGVSIVGPGARTVRVAFDRPEAEARAAVARALGKPDDIGVNDECGGGPMGFTSWKGSFSLVTQEGRFQGWSLRTASIKTSRGMGVGVTRKALTAAYPGTTVEDSTLGKEFVTPDGISGLFSGPGQAAKVETLWAGLDCSFR